MASKLREFLESTGYLKVASPDGQKFIDAHEVDVVPDRNEVNGKANGDDVFKASNIKTYPRKPNRKGYDAGADKAAANKFTRSDDSSDPFNEEYGDKRDFPKRHIHVDGKYVSTTTWAKTNEQARDRFLNAYPEHQGKKITVVKEDVDSDVSEAVEGEFYESNQYSKSAVDKAISSSRKKIGGKEAKMIHALLKGRQKTDEPVSEDTFSGKPAVAEPKHTGSQLTNRTTKGKAEQNAGITVKAALSTEEAAVANPTQDIDVNHFKKIRKTFDRNEDRNEHSKNAVLIAKHVGSDADHNEAKDIYRQHQKLGHLSGSLMARRSALYDKLKNAPNYKHIFPEEVHESYSDTSEYINEMPNANMNKRDLVAHIKKLGWKQRDSGGSGDHEIYTHANATHKLVIPRHNNPKVVIINKILKDAKRLDNNLREEVISEESPTAGTRKIQSFDGDDGYRAEVRHNKDWGEYSVHHYHDGKHMGEGPVSYHDDKQDAMDTAEWAVKNNHVVNGKVIHKGGVKESVSEDKVPTRTVHGGVTLYRPLKGADGKTMGSVEGKEVKHVRFSFEHPHDRNVTQPDGEHKWHPNYVGEKLYNHPDVKKLRKDGWDIGEGGAALSLSKDDIERKFKDYHDRQRANGTIVRMNKEDVDNNDSYFTERNDDNKLKKDLFVANKGKDEIANGINFVKYQPKNVSDIKGHDYHQASYTGDDADGFDDESSARHTGRKTQVRIYKLAGRKALNKEDIIGRSIDKYVKEELTLDQKFNNLLEGQSEMFSTLLRGLYSKLNEENQKEMVRVLRTENGINELIDFAIKSKG